MIQHSTFIIKISEDLIGSLALRLSAQQNFQNVSELGHWLLAPDYMYCTFKKTSKPITKSFPLRSKVPCKNKTFLLLPGLLGQA
jgi:hypothetical protein